MKHTKQDYIKILTRYQAFGDCCDFDNLLHMIGDEFKDHNFRYTVSSNTQRIENNSYDYWEADDQDKRNKFFDEIYKGKK